MIIKFTIDGDPVGKGRPRFTSGNGVKSRPRAYTPATTANYEKRVKLEAEKAKLEQGEFGDSAVYCMIEAYYPIPKSTSKKNKTLMLRNGLRPTKKPDIDNVIKCILDGCNGILYKDDNQVVEVKAEKFYGEEPRVEVWFRND